MGKTFRIPRLQVHTLKESVLHPLRRRGYNELHVLRDISFEIGQGEFFGVVGRNGSGKSTLLKCLAGIYDPDVGSVDLRGRLSPFIELGVGFNPDLTARDNVLINAVMMGLSPREARARFDDIIAFAELEAFVELKLKNYSSGMQVRLAFSIMVQADADVMLIDEVLAVGDAAFQQKCLDVFYRLRDAGKTIVLVTHDMAMVERFCHRALLIEDGRIRAIGDPGEVGRQYLEMNFGRPAGDAAAPVAGPADQRATLADIWLAGPDGERLRGVAYGEPLLVHAIVEVNEPIAHGRLELWIDSPEGVRMFGAATDRSAIDLRDVRAGERLHVTVRADNPLAPNHYYVGYAISAGSAGGDHLDYRAGATDFLVYGTEDPGGLVRVRHEMTVDREPSGR